QIAFEEPRPPRKLNSSLPADLETILLKTMSKDPNGRYATAQELADDLRRFLELKPIRARRPNVLERAAKWSRRHQALVGALIVILAVTTTALAISTVLVARERNEARRQGRLAEERLRLARDAVDQMLSRVGEKTLAEVPQMEQVRRGLLEEALRFYQVFLQQEGTDATTRVETAEAYHRVAEIQGMLGKHGLAERSYRRALELWERLTADFPNVPKYRDELAATHNKLGRLLKDTGRLPEAERSHRRALELHERL